MVDSECYPKRIGAEALASVSVMHDANIGFGIQRVHLICRRFVAAVKSAHAFVLKRPLGRNSMQLIVHFAAKTVGMDGLARPKSKPADAVAVERQSSTDFVVLSAVVGPICRFVQFVGHFDSAMVDLVVPADCADPIERLDVDAVHDEWRAVDWPMTMTVALAVCWCIGMMV